MATEVTEPRGDRARRAMIDAAEQLIAEQGLGALSLREVATVAGQRNHSAVQYHFGSKTGLVEAVFDARMAPIDARRAELLASLEEQGATDDLLALSDVIVRPVAEVVVGGAPGHYGRFLAEVFRSEPELLAVRRPVMASLHQAGELMFRALDEVPEALRGERLALAVRAAVWMLADREQVMARGRRPASPDEVFVAHVVDLVHAMVVAPPSAVLARALAEHGADV